MTSSEGDGQIQKLEKGVGRGGAKNLPRGIDNFVWVVVAGRNVHLA